MHEGDGQTDEDARADDPPRVEGVLRAEEDEGEEEGGEGNEDREDGEAGRETYVPLDVRRWLESDTEHGDCEERERTESKRSERRRSGSGRGSAGSRGLTEVHPPNAYDGEGRGSEDEEGPVLPSSVGRALAEEEEGREGAEDRDEDRGHEDARVGRPGDGLVPVEVEELTIVCVHGEQRRSGPSEPGRAREGAREGKGRCGESAASAARVGRGGRNARLHLARWLEEDRTSVRESSERCVDGDGGRRRAQSGRAGAGVSRRMQRGGQTRERASATHGASPGSETRGERSDVGASPRVLGEGRRLAWAGKQGARGLSASGLNSIRVVENREVS